LNVATAGDVITPFSMLTEYLYAGSQSPLCVTKVMFHEPSNKERASAAVARSRVAQPNSVASNCLFIDEVSNGIHVGVIGEQ
jgi:hypothetical protein